MSRPGLDPRTFDPRTQIAALSEERRRRRRRLRLAIWAGFLVVGLLFGVVWATGFATTEATTGSESKAAAVLSEAGEKQDAAALAGKISHKEDLTWSWSGRWGSIATATMYEIDLSSFASSEKFFSEVVLTNEPTLFSDLQLQLRIAKPEKTSCEAKDLEKTESSNDRAMVFDAADAQVTFSGMKGETTGLPGESKYCIGIFNYSGSGKDTGGTFIRKSEAGSEFKGTYPAFVATVDRME